MTEVISRESIGLERYESEGIREEIKMQLRVRSAVDRGEFVAGNIGDHAAERYAWRISMSSGGSCRHIRSVEVGVVEFRTEKTTSGVRWQFSDIIRRGLSGCGIL